MFACSEHVFVVVVRGAELSSRGSPGHRVAGCAECDTAVDDAFDAAGFSAVSKRAYWTTKPYFLVECQDCAWDTHGTNGQGLAARHHDATGHVVRVDVERAIYYGEDRPGQRRWWKSGSRL